MIVRSAAFAIVSATLLASCATGGGGMSGIDVTRFHLDQPVARGAVFVEAARPADAGTLEFRGYADAVAAELRRAGFTPVPALAGAEIVATLDYSRATRESVVPARSPITIGIGGASFGRHTGIGGGASFGVGKKRSNDVAVDTLALQLKRRSDASVVWEGRAVSQARVGSGAADASSAPRLARALLSGYPGPSGKTVHVQG